MIQSTLLHFDTERYRLLAWTVMPNHVHALIETVAGWEVGEIVSSWKKFTALKKIHDFQRYSNPMSELKPVWHREYWDRYMRDQSHYRQMVEYIHENPVKAGLVPSAGLWPWSSAHTPQVT